MFCLQPFSLGAQEYRLEFRSVEGTGSKIIPSDPVIVPDSMGSYRELKQLLGDLRGKGYLAASADSILADSTGAEVWIYAGPRFRWGSLVLDSVERKALRKAGVRQRSFSGKPVRYNKLAAAQDRLVSWYENQGYPFAGLHIRNIQVSGETVSGDLVVERGQLFLIDTLHIKGEARIRPSYVERLTGIWPGEVYREDRIQGISDRIRETPFLEEIKPAELEFFREKVDVYTYLQKSRANQFNGIIGLFPNHEQTGKLFVTGDLNLYLVNSFGRGESFRFAWKSLQPLTQELDLELAWPYLFNSPVGVGLDFNLLKQDTSWLSVNPVLDLKFSLGGDSWFNVFVDYFRSSIISTEGLENLSTLPPWADVSSSLYGLGLEYRNLDYLFNPRKGWNIQARAGIGGRKIHKNPALDESIYQDAELTSTKFRGWTEIGFYQRIAGNFVLHLRNLSGFIYARDLFENELFRLGGIHSLRGVDENSILASLYSTGTIEFRYLFEQNSSFFLFLDGGYYESGNPASGDFSDTAMGFGGGINLSSRAGIFSLVYALGKQFDNPLNIRDAKIHIGYLNRF